MTSDGAEQDRIERDELIWQLHEQGNSIRAIAAAVDRSPTQTYRVITAMAELYEAEELSSEDDYDDDDEDDDEIIADTYEPVPEFTYVGLAAPEDRKGRCPGRATLSAEPSSAGRTRSVGRQSRVGDSCAGAGTARR